MSTTEIDKFAAELVETLKDFHNATDEVVADAVKKTAKDAVKKLKSTSPTLTGDYAKSWTMKKNPKFLGRYKHSQVVYAGNGEYRLAHLLEKGHAIKRGGRVIGSAPANIHIGPVDDAAEAELTDAITRGIQKIGG